MADNLTKAERSKLMSKVSQKNTKPEMIVRKYLHSKGFRYRTNVKKLPGSPDIVLAKYKTVIFVHGCYWHGHSCRAGNLPSTNLTYWQKKISDNQKRDTKKENMLKELGWKVLKVWGCEVKTLQKREERLTRLVKEILQDES